MLNPKAAIENAFINKLLEHVLDGNKGSNILTALLVPILAAHIDWALALKGAQFDDMNASLELAKVIGLVLLGLFGYFVGKKK